MLLKDELEKLIEGDVSDDVAELRKHSTDYSLLEVLPQIVAYPKDAEDLGALVKFVTEHKDDPEYQTSPKRDQGDHVGLSLTARSAGTDMTGGPLNHGIILDFTKYFNNMGHIENDRVSAQPGVYYRDFEKTTLEHGLIFPSYPASKRLCAIGGIVNNNSGGEKSLIYGKTEKYVHQIKAVLSDGNEYTFEKLNKKQLDKKMGQKDLEGQLYRDMFKLLDDNYDAIKKAKPNVSKNSAGYALWNVYDKEKGTFDLTQLICGAQGTLGLMTEATIGLVKPKEHSALLVMFINEFKELGGLIEKVLRHKPETLESYDDNTFNVAVKLLPSMIKNIGLGATLSLGWRFLPEFWITLTSGQVPKLVLIAEFTGDSEEEIYDKARRAEKDIKTLGIKTHIAKDDKEEDKYWMIRREAFKLLTDHSKGKRTAPVIDDIVVNPDTLAEFLPRLQKVMDGYDLIFTIQGHIGDGNFHIIPLIDIGDEKIKELVPRLEEEVFSLVFEYGGSMTGEHNDGIIRSHYLPKMYGQEIYDLFVQTKKIWDPDNIFNPGKKIGNTKEFVLRHIDLDPSRFV